MRHTVECNEGSALGHGAYYYLVALNHVGVEAVQRLAVCKHDVVGYVDDVVDWALPYGLQLLLQPLRAFGYVAAFYGYGAIARAGLVVVYHHVDVEVVAVDFEIVC